MTAQLDRQEQQQRRSRQRALSAWNVFWQECMARPQEDDAPLSRAAISREYAEVRHDPVRWADLLARLNRANAEVQSRTTQATDLTHDSNNADAGDTHREQSHDLTGAIVSALPDYNHLALLPTATALEFVTIVLMLHQFLDSSDDAQCDGRVEG